VSKKEARRCITEKCPSTEISIKNLKGFIGKSGLSTSR